jgi:hypothetical protein
MQLDIGMLAEMSVKGSLFLPPISACLEKKRIPNPIKKVKKTCICTLTDKENNRIPTGMR